MERPDFDEHGEQPLLFRASEPMSTFAENEKQRLQAISLELFHVSTKPYVLIICNQGDIVALHRGCGTPILAFDLESKALEKALYVL